MILCLPFESYNCYTKFCFISWFYSHKKGSWKKKGLLIYIDIYQEKMLIEHDYCMEHTKLEPFHFEENVSAFDNDFYRNY